MLSFLQNRLAEIYEANTAYDVNDFLVTDMRLAQSVPGARQGPNTKEQLLISQDHKNHIDIMLYIDKSILVSLQQNNPVEHIHPQNLNNLWLAIEGVSHFLYLTWHGERDRPITRLELELQAEVDKFICTRELLLQQQQFQSMHALHTMLFEEITFHDDLDDTEMERYLTANRYAAKYCLTLLQQLRSSGFTPTLTNELRRFYRLSQNDKIRHINTLH